MWPIIAVAAGITGAFLSSGSDDPPERITQAPNPIANKFPPIDFIKVFDELSKDSFEIIKDTNGKPNLMQVPTPWGTVSLPSSEENNTGKLNIKFSNEDNRVDLSAPVQARGINTKLPPINPINERAAGVVALSQAMTRLSGAVEQMENTSPYLIAQNQELINSFRDASTKALDRGFDFRQYAIDQRLKKMGLDNSSTAFGTQVALAREKANAYSDLELKQAELAQGLKQQSLANLHQRGDLLGKNAAIEQNKFNAESQAELANQELIQKQAISEKEIEFKNEEQRLGTEFGNKKIAEARRDRMAQLGFNAFNNGNNQAISARQTDNNAIAQANGDELARYDRQSDPMKEIGHTLLGASVGSLTGGSFSGSGFGGNGLNQNPWKNPDSGTNPMSFGTNNWSPSKTKLIGSKKGGMEWT